MTNKIIDGMKMGFGFLLIISIVSIVFAGGYHLASEIIPGQFATGDYSFDGNLNVTATNDICITGSNCLSSAGGSIPTGAIMAFYLTICPSGWIPADGTSSTPDLRGVFIRGMETFDAGSTYNNRDPDRSGAGALGSYQADELGSHNHVYTARQVNLGAGMPATGNPSANPIQNFNTGDTGGTETRSKNVALIYCMKS